MHRDRLAGSHVHIDAQGWNRQVVQRHPAVMHRQGNSASGHARHAGRAKEEVAGLNRELTPGCRDGPMDIRAGGQPG